MTSYRHVQPAVDAYAEVRDYSKVVSPKEAFDYIDAYKASTGHRPSLSAMVLLYLREKARADGLLKELAEAAEAVSALRPSH